MIDVLGQTAIDRLSETELTLDDSENVLRFAAYGGLALLDQLVPVYRPVGTPWERCWMAVDLIVDAGKMRIRLNLRAFSQSKIT